MQTEEKYFAEVQLLIREQKHIMNPEFNSVCSRKNNFQTNLLIRKSMEIP